MNRRVFLGLALGAVVLVGIGWGGKKLVKKLKGPEVGDNLEMTDELKSKFGELGVMIGTGDSAEKISLAPVSGEKGSGVATREFTGGSFLHSVIADLEKPGKNEFYEGWLVSEEPMDVVYTGRLEEKKGGWVLEYVGKRDLSDHPRAVITREKVDDQKPEEHVLEGRFGNGGEKE